MKIPVDGRAPLRLVILEDKEDDAALMCLELEAAGFDVQAHRIDTREAFRDCLAEDVDLILADYTLPQFNALEALDVIHSTGLPIPVIVVTGSVSEEVAVECMRRGAADYLLKDRLTRLGPAVERALQEEALRLEKEEAHQALRYSEAFGRAILHSLSAHIAVVEEDGTIVAVNEAWNTFARENGDPELVSTGVGTNYLTVLRQGDATGAAREARVGIEAVLAGDVPSFSQEYPCHSPDEQRWFKMVVTPLQVKKRAAVVAHHDITERKLAEVKLKDAKDRAEELSRLKTTFLNNMSHELRTPLTGIIGFSTLLKGHVHGDEETYRKYIEESGQRLLNTLSTIFELSLLESGTVDLELEEVDVGALVTERTETLWRQAGKHHLVLDVHTPTPPVRAHIDRNSLERIVHHLVDNAIKFTDEGRITVRVALVNGSVEIQVADTGIGIAPSFRPYIFEEFRQGSTGLTRTHDGNGLGLTIVQRLVHLLEGTISVESQPDKGSTFTVMVPLRASSSVEPMVVDSHHAIQDESAHILAVDDSLTMRELLLLYLRDRWQVSVAESGESALAMARSHRFNLVLLDIKLEEGYGGLEILKTLRKEPAYRRVPFIALTGYALPGDRTQLLNAGFDDYLSKPFTKASLREAIIKHL